MKRGMRYWEQLNRYNRVDATGRNIRSVFVEPEHVGTRTRSITDNRLDRLTTHDIRAIDDNTVSVQRRFAANTLLENG